MCGIVGYVGPKQAYDYLIEGLFRLEYRGYDSAGIALQNGKKIGVRKKAGRVSQLAEMCKLSPMEGSAGIGHTRWATHGEPSDTNSHPHTGGNGEVVLVHNGVIENYSILRDRLRELGYVFRTATDTEGDVWTGCDVPRRPWIARRHPIWKPAGGRNRTWRILPGQ